MENIFENAYFGKQYKTRDGRKALYLTAIENGQYGTCHKLAIEDEEWDSYYDCEGLNYEGRYAVDDNGNVIEYWDTDIVSEWNDNINTENLVNLAKNNNCFEYGGYMWEGYNFGFVAGYRKAKEEL